MKLRRTLTFFILALSLMSAGCKSDINRAIVAVNTASDLIPLLNLSAAQQKCATEGFRSVSAALTAFKSDPTGPKWRAVTTAVTNFRTSECLTDARLVAILRIVQRILASIEPAAGTAGDSDAAPDFKAVRDSDLDELEEKIKELERAVGKRK